MSRHEPVVTERVHSAISESKCSCGTKLPLGKIIGTPKQQYEKLREAFAIHKKAQAKLHQIPRQQAFVY
jgi:hypothetical protein